jgi:radical SAM protein (TIGR01212 family)
VTDKKFIYNRYSEYLVEKYGQKVYKLPVNIEVTCPNRDGAVGHGGCIFCGEEGAGFETLSSSFSVYEQLNKNKEYIKKRYKANKFIAYFQNYTNTYMPLEIFEKLLSEAASLEDIVEIAISTRPDSISIEYLEVAKKIKERYQVNISFELGLQTANYHSLIKVNRGHTLAEFIEAVIDIHQYGFEICTHIILNLPWDTIEDVIETAKVVSALKIEQVKLHALFIVKNTPMAVMYENNEINIIEVEEYKNRVITFLEYLSPDVIIQRIIGRAPEENTLFVNWNTSWWKIRDDIEEKMLCENHYQGRMFNYLGGKAVRKFL